MALGKAGQSRKEQAEGYRVKQAAEFVEALLTNARVSWQKSIAHHQRQYANRHIDSEQPGPAGKREHASRDRRAGRCGYRHDQRIDGNTARQDAAGINQPR